MSDTKRIKWTEGARAQQGAAGGIHLFTISWNTVRGGKSWVLGAKLPGVRTVLGEFDTTDEAKAKAEAALAAFVEKLGARF